MGRCIFIVWYCTYFWACCANVHPSPVPYSDFVTTTTHKTLRGPRGAMIMCKKEFSKLLISQFSWHAGWPIYEHGCAKAVAYNEALNDEFKSYATSCK